MTVRVVFTEPPLRDKEEPGLPPLFAGWDLINNLSPMPNGKRKESPLSKQGKGPVCEEELLGEESIPKHLRPQMDSPRQEPPTVWG